MYVNSTIVGIVSFFGYIIAGALINAVGNRNLSSKSLVLYSFTINRTIKKILFAGSAYLKVRKRFSLYSIYLAPTPSGERLYQLFTK